MPLPSLSFTDRASNSPDVAGYSAGDPGEVLAVKLDGGASRYRRDILVGAVPITCQWTLTPADFEDFQDFYKNDIANGAEPFLVKLILDDATVTECTVHIVPGSKKVVPASGRKSFLVQVELEVSP